MIFFSVILLKKVKEFTVWRRDDYSSQCQAIYEFGKRKEKKGGEKDGNLGLGRDLNLGSSRVAAKCANH